MLFFSVIKLKSKETLNLSSKQVCVGVKTGKGGDVWSEWTSWVSPVGVTMLTMPPLFPDLW